jgi:hypothetical protein
MLILKCNQSFLGRSGEIGNFIATNLKNHTFFAQPSCLSIFDLSESNSAISEEVISI